MSIMYISQKYGRPWALATAISELYPSNSFQYVGEINKFDNLPVDCKGIVIVGSPEFIFGPEENYWNFLSKANERKVKVAGISITKKITCFPNNNKGIGKFMLAKRRKIKDLVKELSDFFEEEV